MRYCKRCVNPSSRPRIEFNEDGLCNACTWHDKKMKEVDWNAKKIALARLCDRFRNPSDFDVIVPMSGGKDGSTVAWDLKHNFGMNPLCVTFSPQMQTWLGRTNLDNLRQAGYNHIMISPEADEYRKLAKRSFIDRGMPKQPFVVGISTSVLRLAAAFGIDFIMWGEHGEQEYGGASETGYLQRFSKEFLINIYYEGDDPKNWGSWWQLPSAEKIDNMWSTWYSLFVDWDPDRHARIAKRNCGLETVVGGNIGTFTSASQLDDVMQDLHTYLMFLKFGFGRCTSDAAIEIRRGRLTREEGVRIVNQLDGLYPLEYEEAYLSYFDMTKKEFWDVLNSFANTDLLEPTNNPTRPWIRKEDVE